MFHYSRLAMLFTVMLFSSLVQAESEPRYNVINIDAQAVQEVDNDELVATLLVQETGPDTQQLSKAVNKRMAKLLERVKLHSDIKPQTMHYSTRPIYKNNTIVNWQTSQSISLTSLNIDLLADVIGTLSDLATIQSLNFGVSALKADATKKALTVQAIANFRDKATLVAHEFGQNNYKLVNVYVNGDFNQSPSPMMKSSSRMMMSDSIEMAPALEAGTNLLRISVNGSIELTND